MWQFFEASEPHGHFFRKLKKTFLIWSTRLGVPNFRSIEIIERITWGCETLAHTTKFTRRYTSKHKNLKCLWSLRGFKKKFFSAIFNYFSCKSKYRLFEKSFQFDSKPIKLLEFFLDKCFCFCLYFADQKRNIMNVMRTESSGCE